MSLPSAAVRVARSGLDCATCVAVGVGQGLGVGVSLERLQAATSAATPEANAAKKYLRLCGAPAGCSVLAVAAVGSVSWAAGVSQSPACVCEVGSCIAATIAFAKWLPQIGTSLRIDVPTPRGGSIRL